MSIKTWLYTAVLWGGTLVSGCQAPQNRLQTLSSVSYAQAIISSDISEEVAEPGTSCPVGERSYTPNNSYQQSGVELIKPDTEDVQPMPDDGNIPEIEFLYLLGSRYPSYPDTRRFNLDAIIYERGTEQSELNYPAAEFNDPFSSGLPDNERYVYRDYEFNIVEAQVMLLAGREIIRKLALEGYAPFRFLEQVLRRGEEVGKKLRDIEEGIREIVSIDITNLEEELTDPLRHLRYAVGMDTPEPRRSSRGPQLYSSLEPTIGGNRLGVRSLRALQNQQQGGSTDFGFLFVFGGEF